jgi:predicted negative regulator of RcsB-dependent stress response
MALELMDEHEKGEHVRAWLRQNGGAIVIGVGLGLALIFGWQWWQRSQAQHRETAALQYQVLSDARERKEIDTVVAVADELARKYEDTPYAALAALQLADVKLTAGDDAAALAALQQVAELAKEDPALSALANLRRARVLLESGDAAAALALVEALPEKHYAGLAAELRGDALHALKRLDEAREAYRAALTELDTGAPTRRIVEMKLSDLGGAPESKEA